MEVVDVVRKLIGPIDPVGESNEDDRRYENLKNLAHVVEQLICDIDRITPNKRRNEFSIKRAGEFADKFFDDLGVIN